MYERALLRLLCMMAMSAGAACSGTLRERSDGGDSDARQAHGSDAGSDDSADQTSADDPPFERPEGAQPYTPKAGTCGFEQPAFCDTFETIADDSGRAGELSDARWSATRGTPSQHASLDEAFMVGPAKLPKCRAGLPDRLLPPQDTLICDPTASISTRHLLTASAAQNYGLNGYRIRQPFDFAGRTGTIKLDVELAHNGLGGWPALVIAEDPSPAPSFDWEERGSGPRNGVSIEFVGGWCNHPDTLEVSLFTFRDYKQKAERASFDCETPHVTTERDALSHLEVYLTRKHLEVWASDPSPDGVDFPGWTRIYEADLDLPFERGYVHLMVRNHATLKYWQGAAWPVRWDNVGFDGPVIQNWREHSAADSLTVTKGLDGCMIDGKCRWRGDVIAEFPIDDKHCVTSCTADGEGRNVGYVVPNADEAPVSIAIPGVKLAGATRARLALAATYPWFDWNGVSKPPTAITLRYRLNGGVWHDRPISAVEANAFENFSLDTGVGSAGDGAGLLNQIIDIERSELREGDNTLELRSAGTWTGSYRVGVAAVDLLLEVP